MRRVQSLVSLILAIILLLCSCGNMSSDTDGNSSVSTAISMDSNNDDSFNNSKLPENSDDTVEGDVADSDTNADQSEDTILPGKSTTPGNGQTTGGASGSTTGKTDGASKTVAATNKTTVKGETTTKGSGSSSASKDFVLPITGLEKKTVYILTNTAMRSPNADILAHDVIRFVVSLQGLLNRDFEKNQIAMYLLYDETDEFWLGEMSKTGGMLNNFKTKKITSFQEFLQVFKAQIQACGIVAWDPNVPATANVAATICGLNGYLPVKQDDSDSGLLALLKSMGVKVKQRLSGVFTGKGIIPGTKIASTGSAKNDAYLWAMEKYMDRTSKRIIAYMPDGAGCVKGNAIFSDKDASPQGNCLVNHDYLIANRCFFFDLSPMEGIKPTDDPNQPQGTDTKTMRKILQRQYDRNNGAFSQVIGFPPWWLKYGEGNSEWMFTDIATQYNIAKEADAAHPAYMSNASVYTYVDLMSSFKNTNRKTTITEKFDKNTVYLLYYMGDYDSSAWLKKWVPVMWSDSGKGKMPMMWSFNPNLSDRMPLAFNYVYSNMDDMDYFAAGDSGAGYVMPSALYQATCPERTNPDGDQQWLKYCKPYMDRFDMDIVGFIINGDYKMNKTVMKLYNKIAPIGSFHNDSSKPLSIVDGVPYLRLKNGVGNPGDYKASAEGMYSFIKSTMSGYNFAGFRTICWTPSQIKALSDEFIKLAKEKDPGTTYKFVDPYTFFAMIRQSGQGKVL